MDNNSDWREKYIEEMDYKALLNWKEECKQGRRLAASTLFLFLIILAALIFFIKVHGWTSP